MDIQARKKQFVQEFLRVADEEIVIKFEKLLRTERKMKGNKEAEPLTVSELNELIDQSERDISKGKMIEARDLHNQVDSWQ